MGSQTLEILRQGVWASLTGGWFYDPHQNVFCNAVHLYLWLFLLCAPFVTYLYFPRTIATWGIYCFSTAILMTTLKVINLALHVLYDKSQAMSDVNMKKPLKGMKENEREDECGVEMQVLGASAQSAISVEQQSEENSGENSLLSIDCPEHLASIIDLKVDVHRKNSSESSDSEGCHASNRPRSLKAKGSLEEGSSKNLPISEEGATSSSYHNEDRSFDDILPMQSTVDECEGAAAICRKDEKKARKSKTRLQRQNSLDTGHSDLSGDVNNPHVSLEIVAQEKLRKIALIATRLQRYRSSESNEEYHMRNRNMFLNHNQSSGSDTRHHLKSLASDSYLENNYAKSDLSIENIEKDNTKMYLLKQQKPMRKDSNSTMSALQLPVASGNSCSSRKRRHSNTGCKSSTNQMSSVRRIKSAALEISCPQPSVSNLSPHPNSAEAIAGEQIKNPQSAMLPPPSKSLVRNPHLNLCPKLGSFSSNLNGAIAEPVYPIAEQADEKSIHEGCAYTGSIESDDDDDNDEIGEEARASGHQRCSTTESESDLERVRTQSTDSETDNNGSRSPLLYKTNRPVNDKVKSLCEEGTHKSSSSAVASSSCSKAPVQSKNGDSGGPSSDCEQASASSKDMLLVKEKPSKNASDHLWLDYNCDLNVITVGIDDKKDAANEEEKKDEIKEETKRITKDPKYLGAIPKTTIKRDDELIESTAVQKRNLGAIPKSTSRASSSSSLKSYSVESFEYVSLKPNSDLHRTPKDQWIVVNGSSHNSTMLPSANHSDILFNHFPRPSYLDTNIRFQPKLRRGSCVRQIENENRNSKAEADISTAIEFGIEDIQNSGNTTLSIRELQKFTILRTSQMLRRVEYSERVYCDYWRPQSLYAEKQTQPKRLYKFPLHFFGRRELKIAMDRLQLLALFDRDLNWFHVVLAVILSIAVCCFGSIILQMGLYKDIFAFVFCIVIAGSQYSLLKSVQPDAASPIHGFNKTVAYSRPIYFCLCSGILVFSHHFAKEFEADDMWRAQHKDLRIFGAPFSPENLFSAITKIMSILLLLFPIFFSLGLFPQINTFCMYILEQVDMHIFGGSAACSLLASILCVFKSFLAVCLLYGPAFGGLIEQKGTQHILFSIFCAVLIPVAYHLSRSASDFTHVWALIKSNLVNYPDESEIDERSKKTTKSEEDLSEVMSKEETEADCKNDKATEVNSIDECKPEFSIKKSDSNLTESSVQPNDIELPDPLPKKLQSTVNSRLKNDLVVALILAVVVLGLHCSTIFTLLQPDLNTVLYTVAGILGFVLHYIIPQLRKHLPWLCFAHPVLRQREYGRFEVTEAAKVMWFESIYVGLCFLERNILYPLVFISALTADSQAIARKYGAPFGAAIISICGLKCVRSAYSDSANQYLILIFSVLFFKIDFKFASETFLIDYFFVSIIFKKSCEFLLKMQFIVTYIAPWQITWGSAFHAFAQPFSVPHSAMLFLQAAISAVLSTPLNPFLGSAIFLTSYVRPIKFWERDYNTRRIDHSNTRLSSQLERDLGADDNNLNSIFYEHLTRSLQHSLCGDLLLGRWGNVNQGDCFVLASDYLNCLVHIIELGNGLCTFQMRGLEFRGTYCQQREVEAISEGVEKNTGCCCCSIGHLPQMLSANAMFSTRWLAWQVVAAQYVLEGYSITENLATATLQVFEFRKVLISYYIKSIIYYTIRNPKLSEWLEPGPIQDALAHTLNRQFVDLDPIFNYNLDEDFDFRALGITRTSFCSVYMPWIQFCYSKRMEENAGANETKQDEAPNIQNRDKSNCSQGNGNSGTSLDNNCNNENESPKTKEKETKKTEAGSKNEESNNNGAPPAETNITKDSPLVSLCLALGLLARRSLATASHSSLSGVEFFLHGLHALFKGDFRITSPRDEWVFGDMELLHGVVAPAVKMALKLHQDHFSSPDEYLDLIVLYDAISTHSKDLVISHEADPVWRSAVLRGAPNLLALRHVMEDGTDEYRIIRLTKRFLSFRVIKLNRECVRGLWAGQQQELIYLRNRNPERGSIQNAKQALRNIINSSCDQPIGYPIYVSPLITSYAETNEQLCRITGGSVSFEKIRSLILECWGRIRQRCREGCSSGSGGIECDTTNETPGVYFSPATANNTLSGTAGTPSYGSQSLSGAGTRGSLACINKPTSSTLLAGLLNRERDQDRESVRDRPHKRGIQSRAERERRATLPITAGTVTINVRDSLHKDAMGSTNSGLKQLSNTDSNVPNGSYMNQSNKMSTSSGNLGSLSTKMVMSISVKPSEMRNSKEKEEFLSSESLTSSGEALIELNKKVIIVDGMEIYDCLDLGRRIDVVWPSEQMRSSGGRSSWKDWSPQEGMVGFVVHYWQPNHPDQRFRSNVNRILYLVEIGDHFVPVGESGIKEYNQIVENRPTATSTGIANSLMKSSIHANIPSTSTDSSPSSNLDSSNETRDCSQYTNCDNDVQPEANTGNEIALNEPTNELSEDEDKEVANESDRDDDDEEENEENNDDDDEEKEADKKNLEEGVENAETRSDNEFK